MQQPQPNTPVPPSPLWRGEYDRIYRLMAAKLRATAERRPVAEAAISPGGTP